MRILVCLIAVIGLTESAGKGQSGHGIDVDLHFPATDKAPYKFAHLPHLFFDSEGIQGTMELIDGVASYLNGYEDDLHYDPVHGTIHGSLSFPKFQLDTKYKANLAYKKPDGTLSIFSGAGNWNITVDNLKFSNVEIPVEYCKEFRNIQFKALKGIRTSTGISGEITGATIDGKPADVEAWMRLNEESQKPFFREFIRVALNEKLRRYPFNEWVAELGKKLLGP